MRHSAPHGGRHETSLRHCKSCDHNLNRREPGTKVKPRLQIAIMNGEASLKPHDFVRSERFERSMLEKHGVLNYRLVSVSNRLNSIMLTTDRTDSSVRYKKILWREKYTDTNHVQGRL
jgi:hypothetical protein